MNLAPNPRGRACSLEYGLVDARHDLLMTLIVALPARGLPSRAASSGLSATTLDRELARLVLIEALRAFGAKFGPGAN